MSKPICGIYLIESKIDGRQYIGQAVDCERRFREHCSRSGLVIDKAIKEYGVENFSFNVIKRCDKKRLNYWEAYYIYKYDTVATGFNEKIDSSYKKHFEERGF